ncbi:hypothetical protein BGX34_008458, partial [Mortierella sp. NVP85]
MPKVMSTVSNRFQWALHYDISNGYDHLPKHPESRPYFAFELDGRYYQPTTLVMGETCATWAFQVLLHNLFKAFLAESNFTFRVVKKQHIDDLLFLFHSKAQALVFRDQWHAFASRIGLQLSLDKSVTTPTQYVDHIGFMLDLKAHTCRL